MDLASLLQGRPRASEPGWWVDTQHTVCVSLEVAGVVAPHAGRPQLLHQDADHVDEDEEVHLHEHQ